MKNEIKNIPSCRDPHEFNNPMEIIAYLDRSNAIIKEIKDALGIQDAKDEAVPPEIKDKVIY